MCLHPTKGHVWWQALDWRVYSVMDNINPLSSRKYVSSIAIGVRRGRNVVGGKNLLVLVSRIISSTELTILLRLVAPKWFSIPINSKHIVRVPAFAVDKMHFTLNSVWWRRFVILIVCCRAKDRRQSIEDEGTQRNKKRNVYAGKVIFLSSKMIQKRRSPHHPVPVTSLTQGWVA